MKKLLSLIIFFLFVFIIICPNNTYSLINDCSQSSIMLDMDDNQILYENNIHQKLLPASITKIMTCIVAIENGDVNKYYEVDNSINTQTGSSIYLQIGKKIKLIDLLYGMMLRSGNDAAYLVAKCVAKDFIYLMNSKAKELNMNDTYFNNPTGLDEEDENYSSAYDMAILMSYAMKNDIFKKIVCTKKYNCAYEDGEQLSFSNKHKLVLSNKYVTGGKTGYTKKAKRTLVTTFSKNDINIVVVTFNCSDDWNVHESLFNYCINNFQKKVFFKKGFLDLYIVNYNYTPIIYDDISILVKNNEQATCNIELLNESHNEIIGVAKIHINNIIKKEILIYRYY